MADTDMTHTSDAPDNETVHQYVEAALHTDSSIYDYSFTSLDGSSLNLADFRGKALLIVNTASQCGFNGQYDGLQSLWERYRDRGLVVIAVPSNDFGAQEPLNGQALKEFCELNYGITFPVMQRTSIKGQDAHPFYKQASHHFGFSGAAKWNFHKYLINAEGELVDWFSSITKPNSRKLHAAIERALPDYRATLSE